MSLAFVPTTPALAKSFHGTPVAGAPSTSSVTVTKAVQQSQQPTNLDVPLNQTRAMKPRPSTKPSSWWVAYRDSMKDSFSPFSDPSIRAAMPGTGFEAEDMTAYGRMLLSHDVRDRGLGPIGDPDELLNTPIGQVADNYMAGCIVKQYKQTATPNGVYNVQCTEGTVKMQAEEARSAALSAQFRLKQRSVNQKFGDFCETRRKAIISAHGCSYEEKLLDKFPQSARAFVTAGSEARGNCVRYAEGVSVEEQYMASCVDKQMKFRAVPMGVYDVLCSDGNAKNVAEYRRVSSLSARFRAQQLPAIVKEQAKFNNAKYARDLFTHQCSYEEDLFNKFPAVSASMRPSTARY